jgi:hypothetical protein
VRIFLIIFLSLVAFSNSVVKANPLPPHPVCEIIGKVINLENKTSAVFHEMPSQPVQYVNYYLTRIKLLYYRSVESGYYSCDDLYQKRDTADFIISSDDYNKLKIRPGNYLIGNTNSQGNMENIVSLSQPLIYSTTIVASLVLLTAFLVFLKKNKRR